MHGLKNTDGLNTEGQRAWHGLRQRADLSGRLRWFLDGSWSRRCDTLITKVQDDASEIFQDKCPFGKASKIWQSFFCLSITYTVPVYLNCLNFFTCVTPTVLTLIGKTTPLSIINCCTFRNAVKKIAMKVL